MTGINGMIKEKTGTTNSTSSLWNRFVCTSFMIKIENKV